MCQCFERHAVRIRRAFSACSRSFADTLNNEVSTATH
jgi:hypothetical protein